MSVASQAGLKWQAGIKPEAAKARYYAGRQPWAGISLIQAGAILVSGRASPFHQKGKTGQTNWGSTLQPNYDQVSELVRWSLFHDLRAKFFTSYLHGASISSKKEGRRKKDWSGSSKALTALREPLCTFSHEKEKHSPGHLQPTLCKAHKKSGKTLKQNLKAVLGQMTSSYSV